MIFFFSSFFFYYDLFFQFVGLCGTEQDINTRIPREEATRIEQYVLHTVPLVQGGQGLVGCACGSYRRGRDTCGGTVRFFQKKNSRAIFFKKKTLP